MVLKVKCPQCGRETEYSEKNPYRPFCCARCRWIDLGSWANEEYVIPGKPMEADDDLDISAEDLAKGKYHDKSRPSGTS
ncbi:MAG: DNA gyrase inhibitor YacG [Burkholderiales bacterium]|nr:DNA gyrase inhibitor YacG [Burkholderiales bacterium]